MKSQTYMQQARALGTEVEFRIEAKSQDDAESIFKQLWLKTEKFQNQFSRFISSSEISRLNANHGHKTEISKDLIALLNKALELSQITKGLFNPFCLPLVQKAGYVESLDSGSSHAPIDYTKRIIANFDDIIIGKDWAKIPKNTAIDLGGIGKGYLADELSKYLDRLGIEYYNLSIGGDLVEKGKPKNQKWDVDVPSAVNNKITAHYQSDHNKFALATSGLSRSLDGNKQLHLIDPRTQNLAESSFLTCSVASNECVLADVIASCILIDGINFAKKMLKLNLITGVLLQGKEQTKIEVLGEGFKLINNKSHSKMSVGTSYA
jgi:thiamine biosynthesis lipoprotein